MVSAVRFVELIMPFLVEKQNPTSQRFQTSLSAGNIDEASTKAINLEEENKLKK